MACCGSQGIASCCTAGVRSANRSAVQRVVPRGCPCPCPVLLTPNCPYEGKLICLSACCQGETSLRAFMQTAKINLPLAVCWEGNGEKDRRKSKKGLEKERVQWIKKYFSRVYPFCVWMYLCVSVRLCVWHILFVFCKNVNFSLYHSVYASVSACLSTRV